MLTALITGASGFCAKHLARRLCQEGQIVVWGTDRRQPSPDVCLDEFIPIDICDPDQVTSFVDRLKPDWVFHLAGTSVGSSEDVFRINLLGSVYLLESLRKHDPDACVLLVGSAAEYGPVDASELPITEECPCKPAGAYGISKHAMILVGLDYARRLKMKVVVARPFNIVGAGVPPSLVVGAIISRAKRALATEGDAVVKVGNLDSKRDFVGVGDVVESYLKMVRGDYWGEVFNLCSGRPYSIRTVVRLILSHAERPIRLEVDPNLIRTSELHISYGSWQKANRKFGFEPVTSLEDAISEAWKHEVEGAV